MVLSVIFYEPQNESGLSSVPPKPGMEDDESNKPYNDWRIVVRLYRGPLLVIIFMFLMGINVYGWRLETYIPIIYSVLLTFFIQING